MLRTLHLLACLLVAGAWAFSGCSADYSPTGDAAPAGSDDERLSAQSLPDDVELIEPMDADELAAWLVAERRPANPWGSKSVVRIIPKQATPVRDGDFLAAGDAYGRQGEAKQGAAKVVAKDFEPKLFERWPKPKLAIVISGLQNGYLEPCGCAGLENMKGGLMRRHTFLKSLEDEAGLGWPAVLAVDLGNLVGRYGWVAEQKYDIAVKALRTMNYEAIGFGPDDLRLGPDALLLASAESEGRFVAANLAISNWDVSPTSRYRVVERGGHRVGITAVLGKKYADGILEREIVKKPAAEALAEVLPKLAAERCDVLILLSHATMEETKELIKRFPKFDIVVSAGGPDEPPLTEEKVPGTSTWLIESGRKGMYLQVVGLFDDARAPRRFQRVPVDARFKDSPDIRKLMVELQKRYKDNYMVGEKAKGRSGWEGLGIRPLPHPRGQAFAGSDSCADCHTKAYAVWSKTPHAHATKTLEKLDIPRQYDPECLSCHVTGWEPQKYFPFRGGFESLAKTAHLAANGCENCHGPGQRHVDIETGTAEATAAEKASARQQMRVTIAQAKASICAACHDLDNSPDYVKHGFDAYWPKVEHKGKE
jgi:hypothetical protein